MPASSLGPTLVFDGDCGFCTSCATYVLKRTSTPLTAVAWQLADLKALRLDEERAAARVYLVVGEESYGGHHAFARILIVQKSALLRGIGRVMDVPPVSWVAALAYRLVARFRHRLPGGTPACALARETPPHTPAATKRQT